MYAHSNLGYKLCAESKTRDTGKTACMQYMAAHGQQSALGAIPRRPVSGRVAYESYQPAPTRGTVLIEDPLAIIIELYSLWGGHQRHCITGQGQSLGRFRDLLC